jgi:hypothetical protein
MPIKPQAKKELIMAPEEIIDPTEPVATTTKKGKKKKEDAVPAVAKEPKVTARGTIRAFLEGKDSFTIDQIVELVGGTKANASTTITLLIKPEKAGKEGPIPFAYDKVAKVYTRVDPNAPAVVSEEA